MSYHPLRIIHWWYHKFMSGTEHRLLPERDFPPYGYVPGHWPHPENDPEGHSYNGEEEITQPLNPERWWDCPDFLYGMDLFNYGYYWEAHESWEQLWHAAGRSGITADFLRALIKLAAAGVKVRQGNDRGLKRHAENAVQEFSDLSERLDGDRLAGFLITELRSYAEDILKNGVSTRVEPGAEPEAVFSFVLIPERADSR